MHCNQKVRIMERRGFEPIKNGITILNTFVEEENYREDFKAWAEDEGYTVKDDTAYDEDGDEVETLYDYAVRQISYDTEDFWNGLHTVKDSSYIDYYVVTGSLGLWNGRHSIYPKTFDNLYDALSACATDAYDIVVKYNNNVIEFECHHHDGVNCFEIRNISYETYDKINWWDDDKDGDVFDFIEKNTKPMSWQMIGM